MTMGVRQGGVLSQFLFAIFVYDLLIMLKNSGLGCRLRGAMANAIIYADDLLLLAISLQDLQSMVKICLTELSAIGLTINIAKSVCIRIGLVIKWMLLLSK